MSETDSRKKGFTKGRSATFSIDGFSFTIGKKLWIKSDVVWKRCQNKDLFAHYLDIPFFTLRNPSRLQSQQLYRFVWCSRNHSWLDVTVLIQTDLLISGCDVRVSDFWKDSFRWTQLQGAIATRVKCTWPHTCTHTQYTIKHVHKPTRRKNYIVLAWHMKFNELLFNQFCRCVCLLQFLWRNTNRQLLIYSKSAEPSNKWIHMWIM